MDYDDYYPDDYMSFEEFMNNHMYGHHNMNYYHHHYDPIDSDREEEMEEDDDERNLSENESVASTSTLGSTIDLCSPKKKSPKDNIYSLQLERFEVFKTQDDEKGHFDASIEIGEKVLRVHKFFLASASETFNAILAARWNKDNPETTTIKIDNPEYTYEVIYELITFIYSGTCTITKENVLTLTDMAEYYGVQLLKEKCSTFLSGMEINIGDLERMFEIGTRYSLKRFLETLKGSFKKYMKLLIDGERILGYNKSFVEFMSIVDKENKMEEEFFDAAYKWAQHQATIKAGESNDTVFDFEKCVKDELEEILCNVKFARMSIFFVQESILQKKYLFTPKELYKIILRSRRMPDQEDKIFKVLCQTAKDEAESKQAIAKDDGFNVEQAIKDELAEVIPRIKFHRMSIKFLSDFVVERGFKIPFLRVFDRLQCNRTLKKEEVFKSVYNLAEKQILKDRKSSPDAELSLAEAVKVELAEVISKIKMCQFSIEFWTEFGFSKEFYLTPFDIHYYFIIYQRNMRNEQELFKTLLNLVEKQALQKQKTSTDKNFNVSAEIQADLAELIQLFNFAHFKLDFLLESIVGKGFVLSPTEIRDFFLKRRKDYGNEEDSIKAAYKLAQKQAMKMQAKSSDKKISLVDAIKAELVETIPVVEFYKMTKNFLTDFVVKNGIITADQARHVYCARLEIKSDDTTMSGVFDDIFDILKAVPANGYFNTPKTWHTLRFASLKYKIPSTPSPIQKMVGAEWFLCLGKDGALTVKFHDKIKRGEDYLIAEMKTTSDFMFDTTKLATLTATHNNV